MPLSARTIAAKRADAIRSKTIRYGQCGHGLRLACRPSGSMTWQWRFTNLRGNDDTLTIGDYDAQTMDEAEATRIMRLAAAQLAGTPARCPKEWLAEQRAPKAAKPSFGAIAKRWYEMRSPTWRPTYCAAVERILSHPSLKAPLFQGRALNDTPIDEVIAAQVIAVCRDIAAPSAATKALAVSAALKESRLLGSISGAHRTMIRIEEIMYFAGGDAEFPLDSGKVVVRKQVVSHLPPIPTNEGRNAITTLDEAREMVRAVEAEGNSAVQRLAWRFLTLTATRPNECIGARFDEIHMEHVEEAHRPDGSVEKVVVPAWIIPPERMKMNKRHVVPLAPAAIDVIRECRALTRSDFLFPSPRKWNAPMSVDGAFTAMRRDAGYQGEQDAHGMRSTFSTIMGRRHGADGDIVDAMLAHAKHTIEARYNRAEELLARKAVAEDWAALILEGAPTAAQLVEDRAEGGQEAA
jgi:integrase